VVCGHIHHAEMREIEGVLYCNDGDWVESLTALVEHHDGRLEILDYGTQSVPAIPPVPTLALPGAIKGLSAALRRQTSGSRTASGG